MERARVAVIAALFVVVSIRGAVVAAVGAGPGGPAALGPVAWPTSTLLVSELQTGGASASDEFAEITNVGASSVDLAGLEIVYVTSTGGTITRKASWAATELLAPGRHLLIANTSGIFAPVSDLTYSGGFAATGGAVVIRTIGGTPIDSLGWGDATNAFVEGTAAAAPAASSSLERRPGGLAGNTIDTNNNVADWFGQASPNPQSLSAPPVPAPGPSPTPSATPAPTVAPTPSPSPIPTVAPTPMPTVVSTATPTATDSPTPTPIPSDTPSPAPTPTPAPTDTPAPTIEPTPTPTPTPTPAPTPTATPSPTETPSSTATPGAPIAIATARALADGTPATIVGVLITKLGALEAGRTAFVQDDTGGIALYLDGVPVDLLLAGTVIQATGTVDDRYAQRTLRVQLSDVIVFGAAPLPAPTIVSTGAVGESIEGSRVEVSGITIGSPTAYADGLGILVDDGTGSVRAIIGADALGGASLPADTLVTVIGPAGQHDSSGTGTAGYRIHATEVGELVVLPQPMPSPSPTPSPSPSPTPGPTVGPTASPTASPTSTPTPVPTPSPTPTPTPSPIPQPGVIAIHDARLQAVGKSVTVAGVVTAEAGRLGTPSLIAIQDSTGGIVVKVPDGIVPPVRGTGVIVTGPIADPYGQLEIRPAAGGIRLTGPGPIRSPADVLATDLGEGTEGILVDIVGVTSRPPSKGTSGDLTFDFADGSGRSFRVMADGSSGVSAATVPIGRQVRITGIAGQRASRKGALDGYRIWIRDRADVVAVGGPGPTPSGAPTISIAAALAKADGVSVTIEATVTAGTALLDTSGRRIVVQDGTGAIEVLLPVGSAGPAVGSVVRIAGAMAHAWGAPRLRAETVQDRHAIIQVQPATRGSAVGQADEWRLVRISGTITKVERFGDRWRAEVSLAGSKDIRVPVLGQAGAGIPSTRLVEGATVTVIGIVKRPYPTATDRRFAVLPRSGADLTTTSAPTGSGGSGGSGSGGSNASNGSGGGGSGAPDATTGVVDVTPDTDLAALAEHLGAQVRVGGLVAAAAADGVDLDDGSATAHLVFRGDAIELLPYLRTGDAIAATGRVEQLDGAFVVIIDGAAGVVRVGDLGQAVPVIVAAASPSGGTAKPSDARLTAAGGLVDGPETWSIAAMGGLSLLSLVVTLIRRRRAKQRLRAVIVARLATLKPSEDRT